VGEPELSLDSYAALQAALAVAGERTDEVLHDHGLDEARWSAIDEAWQERLSAALDDESDSGVPEILSAYAQAYARAQRASAAGMLSLAQFTDIVRRIQATGDLQEALAKLGVSMADFLLASEHWNRSAALDGGLRDELKRALAGSR
jgi:hypothetical protein